MCFVKITVICRFLSNIQMFVCSWAPLQICAFLFQADGQSNENVFINHTFVTSF